MILADKIIMLRKQNGWSQEELAVQMDVSRQSVSKWESAAAVPDLNKILKLSELFGVSTDYLLKDEMEQADNLEQSTPENEQADVHFVSLDEANQYLDIVCRNAKKIAGAVSACILSPVTLIVLGGLSEYSSSLSDKTAAGIGMTVLFLMVAGAVAVFIMTGMQQQKYEYLEKENITVQYGVIGLAQKKQEDFLPTYRKCITGGVLLCIISVIPLVSAGIISESEFAMVCCVGVLLVIVACGVYMLVWAGMIGGSYKKLLEEGEYSREKKRENSKNSTLSTVYWCTATALYLGVSFLTNRWEITWVVWPCAGVLFAAVCGIASMIRAKNNQ